jgi:hypothetical protein
MKFMKFNFLYVAFALFTLAFVSCEADKDATSSSLSNYVGLEATKYVGLLKDETKTYESKIYATDVASVDRVYTLTIDPSTTHNPDYFTFPASVTIPAGQKVGTFQVSVTGTDIGGSGNKIVLAIENKVGENQNVTSFTQQTPLTAPLGSYPVVTDVTMGKISYFVDRLCETGLFKVGLAIKFDNYPEETAWRLYDASMNIIDSGGIDDTDTISGYADLGFADASTFSTSFCLPSGDYTFVIYDDYGDGMFTSTAVQGNYVVKFGDTVLAQGSGNFGSIAEHPFTIP